MNFFSANVSSDSLKTSTQLLVKNEQTASFNIPVAPKRCLSILDFLRPVEIVSIHKESTNTKYRQNNLRYDLKE